MLYITRRHSGKMQGLWSLNSSVVMNEFCKKMAKTDSICSKCYGKKLEAFRKKDKTIPYSVSWYKNGIELSCAPLTKIPKFRKAKVVRFHSVGELINRQHLENFAAIARANKETLFSIWTKRKNLFRNFVKPENMILIYSEPKINKEHKKAPKGFNKVFTVYNKKFAKENNIEINCEQKCVTCMKCYSHNNIQVINELMKKEKSA